MRETHADHICERCGHLTGIGLWPFCPHGEPTFGVIDDQLEGGPRRFETMGADAPYIESKSQWRLEVAKRELVHVDRHDRHYHDKKAKEHDERLRDTGAADEMANATREAPWTGVKAMEKGEVDKLVGGA